MFMHNDLIKDDSLTCCDRKKAELQVYLVDRPPMRYYLKLFQFILYLMEVMYFVKESIGNSQVGWLKPTAIISSSSEINWNMQQYAGKALQEQGHCGTLVPNRFH